MDPQKRAAQLVQAALWLYMNGDKPGAERLASQALELDPASAQARNILRKTGAATVSTPTPGPVPDGGAKPKRSTQPLPSFTPPEQPEVTVRARPQRIGLADDDEEDRTIRDNPFAEEEALEPTSLPTAEPAPPAPETRMSYPPPDTKAPGPSQRSGTAYLLRVLEGKNSGITFKVTERRLVVGRKVGVLVFPEDPFVSPAHASFFVRDGQLWVADAGSGSGVFVTATNQVLIMPGDELALGQQRFRYTGPLPTPSKATQPTVYGEQHFPAWCLEHVLMGNRVARVLLFDGPFTIGRSGAALNFPDDPTLAPSHCELRPSSKGVSLIDQSGDLGIYVRVHEGTEQQLQVGQRLRIGTSILQVSSG